MLFSSRPASLYSAGTLVGLEDKDHKKYLLIQKKRWARSEEKGKKQWVYDGGIYRIEKGALKLFTHTSSVPESRILSVLKLEDAKADAWCWKAPGYALSC